MEAGSLSGDEPRPARVRGSFQASQPKAWWSGRRRLLRFCFRDLALLSGAFRNRFGRGLACRLAVLDLAATRLVALAWREDSCHGRRAADRATSRRHFSPTAEDSSQREGVCLSD